MRKYWAITTINLQSSLAYVWDIINRSFFIVIIMFIFIQLWSAVYGGTGTNEIEGISLAQLIWYLLIAETMELGKVRHDVQIAEEVKDGSIAYTLIRPYNYLGYHLARGLAESLVRISSVLLLGMPIVWWHVGAPTFLNWSTVAVLFTVFFALAIDFVVHSMIGLMAFVMEDVNSLRMIYQKLVFILGGLMLPLEFLPEWLQLPAKLLPFHLTTYTPARLFVSFSWSLWGELLGLQIVWLGILGGLLFWQYRALSQRLAVNGG